MSKHDDGGAVFPSGRATCDVTGDEYAPQPGITLLDYFAGRVMQGMYAATPRATVQGMDYPNERACAQWAYAQADAMIAEKRRREADGG